MPIITLQRQWQELGRIRTGEQKATASGKKRPSKLSTFRLTSPNKGLLDMAQVEYGGTVRPWEGQFELITEANALPVMVPPGQTLSQFFESWTGGGCNRRCDGVTEFLSASPCLCSPDPEERECKPVTRLSVLLPAIPGIGVWRLETRSYYAAVELAGTADILSSASRAGMTVPAQLRLDAREVKRPGQPTKQFMVPVLELPTTTARQLMAAVKRGTDIDTPTPARLHSGSHVAVVASATPAPPSWGPEPELPDDQPTEPAEAFDSVTF